MAIISQTRTRTLVAGSVAAAAVAAGSVAGLAFADEQPIPEAPGVCKTVAHIGDSTSMGMTDPQVIPDEKNRLEAKYAAVAGVEKTIVDAAGGRAIVEAVGQASPGVEAVRAVAAQADCFVVALGTNDAANEAVGSQVKADQRIEQVLSLTAGKPVLWPTVKTTEAAASVNGYAPAGMAVFNEALIRATQRFSNLTVFKWDEQADDALFVEDGIHYTADGTQKRIDAFAEALKTVSQAGPSEPATSSTAPGASGSTTAPTTPAAASTGLPSAPATVTQTVTVTVTEPAPVSATPTS